MGMLAQAAFMCSPQCKALFRPRPCEARPISLLCISKSGWQVLFYAALLFLASRYDDKNKSFEDGVTPIEPCKCVKKKEYSVAFFFTFCIQTPCRRQFHFFMIFGWWALSRGITVYPNQNVCQMQILNFCRFGLLSLSNILRDDPSPKDSPSLFLA